MHTLTFRWIAGMLALLIGALALSYLASSAAAAPTLAHASAKATKNNLDLRTAQNAAKEVARRECQDTSGCTGYGANNVHRVSRHKAVGKIFVDSVKNGEAFQCRQQIVLHLDHDTGRITYGLSHRRCVDLGPARSMT